MKFASLFTLLVACAVLHTSVHAAFPANLTEIDIKPTTRFQSWVKTGSGLSTTISVESQAPGASVRTTTILASGTLTTLRRQLDALLDRCVLSTEQRCDLIDLLDFMLPRARNSNVKQALSNLQGALVLDKVHVDWAMDDLHAIDQALAGGANVQHQAVVAHNHLVDNGGGGHCTYNYRRCADHKNSFKTRNHHCYWAVFRCTQDLDSPNRNMRVWCGWLMQASIQNFMRIG